MLRADPNNPTFQHEYGHYIQSQNMGPAYLFAVGIPSLASAAESSIKKDGSHKYSNVERDANYLGFEYFSRYSEGFYQDTFDEFNNPEQSRGWYFLKNPLYPKDYGVTFVNAQDQLDMLKARNTLPNFYIFLHF